MRSVVFGAVMVLASAGAAGAQVTTNCTAFTPGMVNCNSYDMGASNRAMNEGMANLGAALGNAMRERRANKEAAETAAIQQACLKPATPLRTAVTTHQTCVIKEALRLEASGATPQEIGVVAGGSCVSQRDDLRTQAKACRFQGADAIFDEQARQLAMRTVMETRLGRSSQPSGQTLPARP